MINLLAEKMDENDNKNHSTITQTLNGFKQLTGFFKAYI
jgi:hypothetical protein